MPTSASIFNAINWYWIVAGSAVQVYSSAAVAYVPVNNATYVAWKATNAASKIASEQDLWDVLVAYGISLPVGATESDTSKAARVSAMSGVTFKALLNHENRIRTLEGSQTITAAQFITGLKALL